MTENDPLGGLDLEGLFKDIEGVVAQGGQISDLYKGEQSNETEEERKQREFEERVMKDSISADPTINVREMGRQFKYNFDQAKRAHSFQEMDPSLKRIWNSMTLETLASTANNAFRRTVQECGQAEPSSPQHKMLQKNAMHWEVITSVVQAAKDLP